MFINDGKSIFGNVGLIVSLVILIVLLFFSYNKCMSQTISPFTVNKINNKNNISNIINTSKIEGFSVNNPPPADRIEFPPPENIRVNIVGSSVTLNFVVDISAGKPVPSKFMVVLVQYDSNMKPTGNNKFYISSEYKININASALSSSTSTISNNSQSGNNLCELINGAPACQYVINNLDMIDTNGNPYYYKIGVSAVYNTGNSAFTTPYNIVNQNGIFSLTSPLEAQNNQFSDYIKYKQMQSQRGDTESNYSTITATPDGQYQVIKSQLGGYPSNLIMDPISAKQNLLADLVDKSMSQARININVSSVNANAK
jgi:hypothetical protein